MKEMEKIIKNNPEGVKKIAEWAAKVGTQLILESKRLYLKKLGLGIR